ncbi:MULTISPECIES: MarR family winged helix-turn-helix transcriptional regulator [unclassified Lentilitoribacter]|jgi:DNA-binding MarR family transcriptional regulator|uniref:MarR family winged helix-turn-helix transcriptional regulator n=1 Tax=unclassified Lentilitoribacter TaxID=2647570 RepID=UPI0013A6A191|nr:MarR family winged helix-turn-helix transcriptional regulator [Lentilitoribacter sp. Alg239-R112]
MTQIPDGIISQAQRNREHSFGYLMQRIARRIDMGMKERLSEIGIDVKIFANLMILLERDGINQRELGDLLDFPDYYTSRNIDMLVKEGFAERRPDPNSRRSFLIYLTRAGRDKAMQLPNIIKESNEHHLSNLDESEQKQIIKLLHKVAGIDLYVDE